MLFCVAMWSFFAKDPTRDFGYEIDEVIPGLEEKSIWKLHKARRKATGEVFSVFAFDLKNGSETQMEMAKASVKRLKTLRHPSILTYVDSLEGDRVIYLVTEYVEPLEARVRSADGDDGRWQSNVAWGLYQLTRALSFLNGDCGLAHLNVCLASVFVNQASEWKLGGVEYTCRGAEMDTPPIKIIPQLEKYDPPEKNDPGRLRGGKIWSADMWGLGCLIWEVFNGDLTKPAALRSPGKVPKALVPLYCELVGANPASRPSPDDFLRRCRAARGYMNNSFIDTLLFLEEIQIKDVNEKSRFFSTLPQHVDAFPEEICRYKILPQLISAFEFGGAGPAILAPLFKLGKLLSDAEYQKRIVPCVVKLFTSTDRATRAKLLQQMEHFVDHLQPNVLNSQVFPEIVHGFTDTNATIREITVKSILHVAPKLNHNNLNVELMKHFARLQAKDPEGGIRTNTTVCLGKIAHLLHPETRKKVLVIAFTRAMRDPFPPARTGGILALAATQKFYPLSDVAQRVLPALCQMTVDPEKSVREQTFKAIKGFLGKLEKVSEDPSLQAEMEIEVNAASSTSVTDTALGWAGWAVTSLTSKLYKTSLGKSTTQTTTAVVGEQPNQSVPSDDAKGKMDRQGESVCLVPDAGRPLSATTKAKDAGHESESDYEDEGPAWNESWGEMDSTVGKPATDSKGRDTTSDGWDTGWDDADFAPVEDISLQTISSYRWDGGAPDQQTSPPNTMAIDQSVAAGKSEGWDVEEATWDDSWETNTSTTATQRRGGSLKHVEPGSKEDREQKRLQRKKEMEERRAQRQTASGPMKLGERKKF